MKNLVTPPEIRAAFSDAADFTEHQIDLGGTPGRAVTLMYLDGLASGQDISERVVKPLGDPRRFPKTAPITTARALAAAGLVFDSAPLERDAAADVISDLLDGRAAVLFPFGGAVTFDTRSSDARSVDAPKEEKVVKGSKDAFVERIRVNTSLIRRKIKTEKLKIREMPVGSETKTTVSAVYVEGVAGEELVAEVIRRLGNIRAADALSAAVIEENLADNPKTPFPQLIYTERPDKFCLNLLEGRVGILVDGLPLGFLAPGTFSQFFKTPEDNSAHFIISSFLTLLRYFAFVLAVTAPALYVAVAMFHQEMIPIKLMQSIIEAKQFVPFPTAFEVIAMLIAFDLLQEAGIRLPTPVGQTVSIIGALIVGQSAVEAKVVSPVVVVVIALSGIAGYTMPNQGMADAVRLMRFGLVILAIVLGMFGLSAGLSLIVYHLASLDSFGVPYLTPFAGAGGRKRGRALLRYPMGKGNKKG